MSHRSIRRTMLGVALGCGLGAVPASAHAPVAGTFPARGATVAPVRTVSVRFANDILTGRIDVARSGGGTVAARAAGRDPRDHGRLRVSFARRLAAGRYTVTWPALDDDGHRQRGTFAFRVR